MKNILCYCAAAVTVAFASDSTYAQSQPPHSPKHHIVDTFHIKSPGKWDYIAINPVTHNIYVAHATQVNILNPKGDSIGVIKNTLGVHGIAFAAQYKKGFTSNGKLNTVTVFDMFSNKELSQIKTGENPDAIMHDDFSKKIYVCNGKSKDLSVIDPATNEVIKTIPLGGKPETAVSDDIGNVYVNIEDKNEIVKVNASSYAVEARWPLMKGKSPTGLAIDAKTKRLFAGCDNKLLVVMDATNGNIVTTLPIGDECDGVAFDAQRKYIYAANGEGTLTIIREAAANKYQLLENLSTKEGARTLTVDTKSHLVYLPTAELTQSKDKHRPDMVPGTFMVLVVAGK
ncbi:MAG: YncE family protein [Bacteroidetes bacterium]|nr:YncE family protein [Bacteroidota bacterium]